MIIYGDSHYESTFEIFWDRLQERLIDTKRIPSLDNLRTLLIQTGQLEQAARDAGCSEAFQFLTDDIAQTFFEIYEGSVQTDLERWHLTLRTLNEVPSTALHVKVPEGFAFYALFPEQYIHAGRDWAARQQAGEHILVVGVRSIGTALSALVSATLQTQGYKVQRLTVRPMGPPFERYIELGDIKQGMEHALVVDEGPGLSGSSMVAVGEALVRTGFSRSKIAFLPGHSGNPGQMGSESVRQWWSTTPRFVAPLPTVRWNDRTLTQKLAALASELLREPIERVEDIGGGLWRHFVYENATRFPPVASTFECPKFLCFAKSGQAVLWKFGGLATLQNGETGAESMLRETNALSQNGWTPSVLAIESGFVATHWIGGKVLRHDEASPEFLAHVGSYLGATSNAPLSPENQRCSLERMSKWLYWNTREALGEEFAKRTHSWSECALTIGSDTSYPTYGDGRMMPHEWRGTENGSYWKLDCCGHNVDHTIVGQQTLAWDIAGMIVEWNLNAEQTEFLLQALIEADGPTFPPDFLRFHYLAYSAFRLGLMTMERSRANSAEQERLQKAIDFYRESLLHWVE